MADDIINIRIDSERKDVFKKYAKKYGGMTPLLLQYIEQFIEQEEKKERRRATLYSESDNIKRHED